MWNAILCTCMLREVYKYFVCTVKLAQYKGICLLVVHTNGLQYIPDSKGVVGRPTRWEYRWWDGLGGKGGAEHRLRGVILSDWIRPCSSGPFSCAVENQLPLNQHTCYINENTDQNIILNLRQYSTKVLLHQQRFPSSSILQHLISKWRCTNVRVIYTGISQKLPSNHQGITTILSSKKSLDNTLLQRHALLQYV